MTAIILSEIIDTLYCQKSLSSTVLILIAIFEFLSDKLTALQSDVYSMKPREVFIYLLQGIVFGVFSLPTCNLVFVIFLVLLYK